MTLSDQPLGPRIRELRLQRGWTQEELAQRAGVSAAAVGAMERRRAPTRAPTLRRYAEALGVPGDELMRTKLQTQRGDPPHGQGDVLKILHDARRALTTREVAEAYGADPWRILDALRRRGLVSQDRTRRPHTWRPISAEKVPRVLETVSEVTARIVVAADGRRYLMVPWEHDLRES